MKNADIVKILLRIAQDGDLPPSLRLERIVAQGFNYLREEGLVPPGVHRFVLSSEEYARHPEFTGVVAEVCLYGDRHGAGWLAQVKGGNDIYGDASNVTGRNLDQCIREAMTALLTRGGVASYHRVVIFAPSGLEMAFEYAGHPRPFSSLVWMPAPQITFNV